MSKHTPGPWSIDIDGSTDRDHCVYHTESGNVICDNVYGQGANEAEANALLIAASPDLLIIAQQLDAWSKEPDTIDLFNLADAARAAIRKAQPTNAD